MYKQVSTSGNTKPRWLIKLIQRKCRLQNGLHLLASDTRIRTENAYTQLLKLDSPLQATHYPEYQYNQWLSHQAKYKKEIHHLGRKIIHHQLRMYNYNPEYPRAPCLLLLSRITTLEISPLP